MSGIFGTSLIGQIFGVMTADKLNERIEHFQERIESSSVSAREKKFLQLEIEMMQEELNERITGDDIG